MKGEKPTATLIMRAMSDDKSLDLFKLIANAGGELSINYTNDINSPISTQQLISKVKLTRKQYYSRISNLISTGLVTRFNGKYKLTSLGKIAYDVTALIDHAIQNQWKLKAIDALESRSASDILEEERKKIIDTLIENKRLREILCARISGNNTTIQQSYPAEPYGASNISGRTTTLRIN
ncbi:MAG TPA: hypothetical protein VH500_09095 [Nitrososphaeraceae archaeon]